MTLDWKLLRLNTMKSYTDKRKTGTNTQYSQKGFWWFAKFIARIKCFVT
jgi:hypothetical protein